MDLPGCRVNEGGESKSGVQRNDLPEVARQSLPEPGFEPRPVDSKVYTVDTVSF